jgi:hypothetical protein
VSTNLALDRRKLSLRRLELLPQLAQIPLKLA